MEAAIPPRKPGWLSLWLPVIFFCALIFALSSFSQLPSPPSGISDKDEHFTMYFLFGLTVVRALAGGRLSGVTLAVAVVSGLVVSAYGASDEFHQSFVPGRDCDVYDWLADTIGGFAAAAALFAWAIIQRSANRSAKPSSTGRSDVLRDPHR
jgi:VanZ family protein